jgi:CheY-like chemotaxis protein/HPt (histidine-containing phosphotransfer) domain-containing protein
VHSLGTSPATEVHHHLRAGGRVLLAEDDLSNQLFARHLLERDGWHVEVAQNGHEAVAAFASGLYDAIVMDCEMPGMDGYRAAAEIRYREGRRHTPIIALTAHDSHSDRARCLAAGMDDCIVKPPTPAALEAALERAVAGTSPLPATPAPEDVPAPPTSSAPVLDRSRLELVCGVDPAVGLRLADVFTSSARERIAHLATAEAHGDVETIRQLTHTLKGSSAAIGATRMEQASARLGKAAASGLADEISACHAELEAAFALTETELKETTRGVTRAQDRPSSQGPYDSPEAGHR